MRNLRIHLFVSLLVTTFLFSGATINKSNAADNDQAARITIEEVKTMLAGGEEIIFIDTRNSSQWAMAKDKVPGAVRLSNNRELAAFANKYSINTAIVTYCT